VNDTKDWATEITSLVRDGGFVTQHDTLREAQEAVSRAQAKSDAGETPNAAAITIYRRNPDASDGWDHYETVPLGSQR
jgi:hypothetical protein